MSIEDQGFQNIPPVLAAPTPEVDMAERGPSNPEAFPLSSQEQAVLEVISIEPEERARLENEIDAIVENLVSMQLTEADKRRTRYVADKVRWEMMGGRILPASLALYEDSSGSRSVGYHPDLEEMKNAEDYLAFSAVSQMLEPVEAQVDEIIQNREERFVEVFCDYARSGPQYGLLASFTVNLPEELDQPITESWRNVREHQIDQSVRHRFGLGEDQNIPRRSEPDMAMRREKYQLDLETKPAVRHKKGVEGASFDAWFREVAKDFLPGDIDRQAVEITRIWAEHTEDEEGNASQEKVLNLELNDGRVVELEHVDKLYEWGGDFLKHERIWPFDLEEVDDFLATYVVAKYYRLFSDEKRDPSFENILNECVEDKVRSAIENDWQSAFLGRLSAPLLRGLPVYPFKEKSGKDLKEIPPPFQEPDGRVNVESRNSMEFQRGMEIGTILRKDAECGDQRMMFWSKGDALDLPDRHESEFDLCIAVLQNEAPDGKRTHHLRVPGYELVGQKGTIWYFTHAEGYDPYTGSEEVEVPAEARQTLAEEYDGIGLTDLAATLRDSDELFLDELVERIAAHSQYTFDETYSGGFKKHRTIESFEQFVEGGRLQVQCTGAAAFLIASLKILFPEGAVSQIAGNMLGRGRRITAVGHAQVVFALDGLCYVLDSTPPLGEGRGGRHAWGWADFGKSHRVRRQPREKPGKDSKESPAAVPLHNAEKRVGSEEERNRVIRTRLEETLSVVFDVASNEELYRKVLKLGQSDPVRRSLEAGVRSTGEQRTGTELQDASSYLDMVLAADPRTIRSMGLPVYDARLLQILKRTLDA
ncbi:MAG: hypothetical protein WCO52_05295 [bacterium]